MTPCAFQYVMQPVANSATAQADASFAAMLPGQMVASIPHSYAHPMQTESTENTYPCAPDYVQFLSEADAAIFSGTVPAQMVGPVQGYPRYVPAISSDSVRGSGQDFVPIVTDARQQPQYQTQQVRSQQFAVPQFQAVGQPMWQQSLRNCRSAVPCQFSQQVQPSIQMPMQLGDFVAEMPHNMESLAQQVVPSSSSTAPSESELIVAVESLYKDQLRPYARILRKRLAEIASVSGRSGCEVDVKDLRAFCNECASLRVENDEGSDWGVTLVGWNADFIDVYSPEDAYPPKLWHLFTLYCAEPKNSAMVLPGGRYSCSQTLVQLKLPFLQGYSLGQVCHIVQLAISQKKLLGYLNGTLVPYAHSQSMVKEKHAVNQRPCSGSVHSKIPVATWEVLRRCVMDLIREVESGAQPVPLSNIKRLFRAKFRVELSETALGYAKVSELLQDQRFTDICEVKLRGHGYVMLPLEKQEVRFSSPARSGTSSQSSNSTLHQRAAMVAPLSMDDISTSSEPSPKRSQITSPFSDNQVTSTPVHTPFPPTPSPTSFRGPGLPRLLGTRRFGLLEEAPKMAKAEDYPAIIDFSHAPAAETGIEKSSEHHAINIMHGWGASTYNDVTALMQNACMHANFSISSFDGGCAEEMYHKFSDAQLF